MTKYKKIGIFGGLFDPPHIGHLIVAQSVLEEFRLDKIIFVPAGNPPHKSKYSSYEVRYEMTKLATKNNKRFSLSDIERKIFGKTYTVEVIKRLKKKMNRAVYLIIGSDQWQEIKTWKTPRALFRECKVIVVPRPNYKIRRAGLFSKRISISHSPLIDISSSKIRKRVKKNHDIRYLVPPEVHRFIKLEKLYKR